MGQGLFGRRRAGASGTSTSTRCVGIGSATLSFISEKLDDDWKKLAIQLGFEEENIRTFEIDNQGNFYYQKFQMLNKWRRRQPSTEGQMDVLCNALEEIGRSDIVVQLQEFPEVPIKMDVPKDCNDSDMIKILLIAMENVRQTHGQDCLLQHVSAYFEPLGMDLVQVKSGSVTFVVRIMSREGLNKLWSMYTTGELAKKLTEILITDELTTTAKSDLAFQATILKSDYEQACRFFDKWEKHQGKDEEFSSGTTEIQHKQLGESSKATTAYSSVPTDHTDEEKLKTLYITRGRPVISGQTALEYCQQRLTEHYKDTASTIPVHPADPSRTVPLGRFYSDLELTKKLNGKETSPECTQLRGETRILDQVRTVPLDSWDDLLNTDIVGSLRIIVSGGAGFGKSILLLRVANASIDPKLFMAKFKLVFLVLLRRMQKSCCVLKAICDQIFPRNTKLGKTDLKKLIDDNEAETLILLDGLDQIRSSVLHSPSKEGEYGVKDILENKVLVKSCVIVTTRPHMIDNLLEEYPHYAHVETRGFTLKTVNKYIANYFAENVSFGDTLQSNLKSNNSLQTLAQIPIMVLFLCIVWENLAKLPDRLTQLYTRFADVLVSRRCNEGEDNLELRKSVTRGLGRVALKGLLDPKGERLLFSSEEFDKKDLKDGCRFGFLQEESITSGLEKINVVTFLHKSFQEFSAADYLASLYSLEERRFHDELKHINADNVYAMKDLLRFTCGISSESPATGFILEHVQKQKSRESINREELGLQHLARELLFESSSSKWEGKLERPTGVVCRSHEDLKALQYYLQCVPLPPLNIKEFNVNCWSCDDITIWRDILLSDRFRAGLGDDSLQPWSCSYTMADRGSDAMQILEETLQGTDERIRDRLRLHLTIDKSSCFDDECVLGYLPYVSNRLLMVYVYDRSYNDVSRLTNALQECSRLRWVEVHDTNLHNNVQCMAPLISPSLWLLTLKRCGLDDDDIPDLIRIILEGHDGLCVLKVEGNAFSVHGLKTLCTHLQSLPALRTFYVGYTGPNEESLKSTVRQYLPKIDFI